MPRWVDQSDAGPHRSVEIRVRGRVQGVGFRPAVWRIAQALGLRGEVRNDADGVLIRLAGPAGDIGEFRDRLERNPPPLARITSVQMAPFAGPVGRGFSIGGSALGIAHTEIAPDARICAACDAEIKDPLNRRHGYGLTNCTHCGPRLSIMRAIPYDRARTTMAPFPICQACAAEYGDPGDRRFHAEPIACRVCGPSVSCLSLPDLLPCTGADPIAFAAQRLRAGDVIALKGVGGYQLVCDAGNPDAVARLRAGKRREAKPFALMARDLDLIRSYCTVAPEEAALLASALGPIVLLAALRPRVLPETLAPGLVTLGFMLPTSPLHVLLLQQLDRPAVMTSGNLTGEPQIIADAEACAQLGAVATHILLHDRTIANRVDDSVVRFMDGKARILRRARGYAPASIALPPGFENAPDILAMGGELKATFCLIKEGQAILSQHHGDLEDPLSFDDYRHNLALYADLFGHASDLIAADAHPEYLSSKWARGSGKPVTEVQHHHAHVAACLCDNFYPIDAPPVLGVVLDGLGWGDDGSFWGGEFLLAGYLDFRRLAAFPAVAMPGGAAAARQPWRNLYAHIRAAMGWTAFAAEFGVLPAAAMLRRKPVATIDAMIAGGVNSPAASSCGRLFDAVAAALGLCADQETYEGDAASRLEALASGAENGMSGLYPFDLTIPDAAGLRRLDPSPMWRALLHDLLRGTSDGEVAARFHHSLAEAVATTCESLAATHGFRTVALSGGCFQNRLLFEQTAGRLRGAGFAVLAHCRTPCNDGGISLGQAVIAAARQMVPPERNNTCV